MLNTIALLVLKLKILYFLLELQNFFEKLFVEDWTKLQLVP